MNELDKNTVVIKQSKLFNKRWYLRTYPDVKRANLDPAKHYLEKGWFLGYNPSKEFDGNLYLCINTDVKKANINPLLHYELYGKYEKRLYKKEKPNKLLRLLRKSLNKNIFKRNIILMTDCVHDKNTAPIDNFAFFEYLQANKKTNVKAYYILNKDYEYYNDIKKRYGKYIISFKFKDNRIIFNKLKFIFILLRTRFVLDSYDILSRLFSDIFYNSKYADIIFTQHGITFFKSYYIKPEVYGQNVLNKTIVSNNFEYNIFKEFGLYNRENIIKSGLFRWDYLKRTNSKTKYIFIYFTYRHYLKNISNIIETNYFKNIIKILKDKSLSDFMKKNNVKFSIALHHALHQFIDKSDIEKLNIKLVTEEQISDMKNEAVMLITDYSSMCFEFMFLNKPVLFYRLDEEEFKHSELDSMYSRNIKSLNKYIFNVIYKYDLLVKKLKYYINNDFKLENKNIKKANKFFYFKHNIRRRFYEYLLKNW